MSNGFGIGPRDESIMKASLKSVGLDESKASDLLKALLKKRNMLIDSSTYHDMYISANTHGPAS